MDLQGKNAVITGGSSGIGLAIARALTEQGCKVAILGRSQDKLDAALRQVPGLQARACDVTDEASVRAAFEAVGAQLGAIDLVVNAAGTSRACRFAEDPDAIRLAREEIGTNLLGTVVVTKVALSTLLTRPTAAVVIVSSGIAYAPHLAEPTHSATKAALHALCRCLRAQLRGTPVRVFEVLPPLTDTELTRAVKGKKVSVETVARAVVRGIERDRHEIRISIVKALYVLSRLSPALAERIVTNSAPTPGPGTA